MSKLGVNYQAYGYSFISQMKLSLSPIGRSSQTIPIEIVENPGRAEKPRLEEKLRMFTSHGKPVWFWSEGQFHWPPASGYSCIEVQDRCQLFWKVGSNRMELRDLAGGNADLDFWLVHVLLPVYLVLERGATIFHAGAVAVGETALLIAGPSHSGKSTLIDALVAKGCPLLADDKVAMVVEEEAVVAHPSHLCQRPWREFETLGKRAELFQQTALPVRSVVYLQKASPGATISHSEIKGMLKVETLAPWHILYFKHLVKSRFTSLSQIASKVRLFSLTVPWAKPRLEELSDYILMREF